MLLATSSQPWSRRSRHPRNRGPHRSRPPRNRGAAARGIVATAAPPLETSSQPRRRRSKHPRPPHAALVLLVIILLPPHPTPPEKPSTSPLAHQADSTAPPHRERTASPPQAPARARWRNRAVGKGCGMMICSTTNDDFFINQRLSQSPHRLSQSPHRPAEQSHASVSAGRGGSPSSHCSDRMSSGSGGGQLPKTPWGI